MELRSDIAAAAAGMVAGNRVDRELRQLADHLNKRERVRRLCSGILPAGYGLMAITNRRVILLRAGQRDAFSADIPLRGLSVLDWAPGLLGGTITVAGPGARAELKNVELVEGAEIVRFVRARTRSWSRLAALRGWSAGSGPGEPVHGQPDAAQPEAEQPEAGQPDAGQPDAGQLEAEQPATGQPALARPRAGQSATGQPATGQPATGQPATGQPAVAPPRAGQPATAVRAAPAPLTVAARPARPVEEAETELLDSLASPSSPEPATRNRAWQVAAAAGLVGVVGLGLYLGMSDGQRPELRAAGPSRPAAVEEAPAPPAPPPPAVVGVVRVIDADSLEVAGGASGPVEVLGIVAPGDGQCGAEEARRFATTKLLGTAVTLIAEPSLDGAGRTLAQVRLPNGTDYAVLASRAGVVKYHESGVPVARAGEIKAAQAEAEAAGEGLWGAPCHGGFAAGQAASSE